MYRYQNKQKTLLKVNVFVDPKRPPTFYAVLQIIRQGRGNSLKNVKMQKKKELGTLITSI